MDDGPTIIIVELAEHKMRPIPETGRQFHLVRIASSPRALCGLVPMRGWEKNLRQCNECCPKCLTRAREIYAGL